MPFGLDDLGRRDRTPHLQEMPTQCRHRVLCVGEQPVDEVPSGGIGLQQHVGEQSPAFPAFQAAWLPLHHDLRWSEQPDIHAHKGNEFSTRQATQFCSPERTGSS